MKSIAFLMTIILLLCLNDDQAQTTSSSNIKNKESLCDFGSPPDWQWAQQFGGTSADYGNDIITDEIGNIYITGSFSGEVSYPGHSYTSVGKRDAFVAKYNSSGTILWFTQFQASAGDKTLESYAIDRDNAGHLYITGYYTGTVTIGTFELPDMGPTNYFYARLDASGNVELAGGPTLAHDDQETGTVVKVDDNGNIYMLVSNTLDRHSITNYSSLFCFDEYGNFRWVYSDLISIFDIEISNNKIFYSGTITGEAYIGPFFLDPPYARDAFMARSDLLGNFEWAEIPGHDASNGESQGYGISVDETGNIYQCGYFRNDVKFGATELSGYSGFVVKASPDGGYLWASKVFGNTTYEITGNSNFIVLFSGSELIKYNSSTGELIATEWITHSPDKLYYCDYNDRIVTTGDFEQNIYISSFNSSLNLLWLWQFNSDSGFGYNVGNSSDQEGNIYCFNYASNPMDYLGEAVGDGMFLAKHDNSGNLIWLKNFYGIQQTYSLGCYVLVDDQTGSVYITGTFKEPFEIPGITTLYPGASGSFYIIRYDLDGNYIWHTQADGAFEYNCLAMDHSGNVLLSAIFMGTVTIGTQELVSDGGSNDAFVAKYDANGQFLWATRGGGESEEYMGLISTDNQDNIYFTGEFDSENVTFGDQSITLNEGDGNILLAKLNSSGQVLWLSVKGGSPILWNDYWGWPTSIVTNTEGYSYVKGWHGDSTYFDNILLTNPFSVKKNYNFFIAKFDPSGNTVWVHSINESQEGFDYNMLDIDSGGNVYLGAQLRDSVWFEDDYMHINPNYPSSYDLFIAKYSAGGALDWVKILPSSTSAGGYNWISCITVLAENELIMGGYFIQYIDLDPFILNSDNSHGMIAYLGDPLTVKDSPILSSEFFSIYPNPAKDMLTVSFNDDISGELKITVTDISGKVILKSTEVAENNQINLDISAIPSGVYLVEVCDWKNSETKKFAIVR